MAKGLFASLIIGTIINQIGIRTGVSEIETMGKVAQFCMGPCIGAGVAFKRGAKPFTMLAAIVAGALGARTFTFALSSGVWEIAVKTGEPVGAFVAAICSVELGKLAEGRTKFDMLLIPALVIAAGGAVGVFASPYINDAVTELGKAINNLTGIQPAVMGLLIGLIVGMVLSSPISSAALCISMAIGGSGGSLAAGAALAGCCAQMVAFAVISFGDNRFGGLFAQAFGSSKVQLPNIIKNPRIWIPPAAASAMCGLLSTTLFQIKTSSIGAGMGSSGLVGQFETFMTMNMKFGDSRFYLMLLLHFVLPVIVSLPVFMYMKKKGYIKPGDMVI